MKRVIRENEGILLELTGRTMIRMITGELVEANRLSVVVDYVHPRAAILPCHSHSAEEAVYVVEGNGEYWIDGERGRFGSGEVVWFAKGCKHMIRNTSEKTMKIVCVFSPPMSPDRYETYETITFEEL